nr:hypothetical protein [Corynebacterium sputi]
MEGVEHKALLLELRCDVLRDLLGECLAVLHQVDHVLLRDDATQSAFQLVLGELFDSAVLAGETLGSSTDQVRSRSDLHQSNSFNVECD